MKLATTTGDFFKYCQDDCQRLDELSRAGFKYVDLSMDGFTKDSVYMQKGWEKEVERVASCAQKLGMEFVQAHSQGGNPLSQNAEEVEFIVDATVRSIEICEMLGIKNTVVHNGMRLGLTKEEWFKENKAYYQRYFDVLQKHNVNMLCENSTAANMGEMYFINSARDMLDFIKYVDHPLVHACWDTGHANCEGSQYDEIVALGKELYAIHFNDNRGMQDEHLIPFFGTVNWDEIMHALIDVGFCGPLTMECTSSLRGYNYWLGSRRRFDGAQRLNEPQLFMQRKLEELLYETGKYILTEYGLNEE